MEWTKFDTRLQSLIEHGSTRSNEYTPGTGHGAELKATAGRMLDEARGLLGPAVARAQKEQHEAYLATQAVRDAESAVEDAWETLHIEVQARLFARLLEDRAAGLALRQEADRVVGPWTPAAFDALGLDRTILVSDTLLAFVGRIVGEDSAARSAFGESLAALKAARDDANREAGEALAAMQALEAARDQARVLYVAAREAFGIALYLDGRADVLGRYMEPLTPSLRGRSTRGEASGATGGGAVEGDPAAGGGAGEGGG